MARKVILDVDPGIDDAVALTMALFDPKLEVVAVTAVAGNVAAEQATRNVQTIVEQLDPPRWPRIGAAAPPEHGMSVDAPDIHGSDGLGEAHFDVAELHNQHSSEKVIADVLRDAPDEVTIIALGPLTNIAGAFQRDNALPSLVDRLVIMGGTLNGPGNATAVAEFNIYSDPASARAVFRSLTTKTLVPLDITRRVIMTYDFLDQLPDETTNAGRFLRRILPFAFRSHHSRLGLEGIHLHDAVALLACTRPELFETQEMAGDVETMGDLTTGATLFDRRRVPEWRCNMEVVTNIDSVGVKESILASIERASGLST